MYLYFQCILCLSGICSVSSVGDASFKLQEDGTLTGLVINWGPVDSTRLHVDPLVVRAKVILDVTGHEHGLAQFIQKKKGNITIKGEGFMWAARGEKQVCDFLF